MLIRMASCDICGSTGDINRQAGWRVLRDFAYLRHACPKCADDARRYVGATHLIDSVLRDRVLKAEKSK